MHLSTFYLHIYAFLICFIRMHKKQSVLSLSFVSFAQIFEKYSTVFQTVLPFSSW